MKKVTMFLVALLCIAIVCAQYPDLHQIYGSATEDGSIEFKVGDNTYTVNVVNGEFGTDPIFYVEGEEGDTITIKDDEYILADGESVLIDYEVRGLTKLNLVRTDMSVDSDCTNEIKDGDETDVDCGGSCPKCAKGKSCSKNKDCNTGYCMNKICKKRPVQSSGGGGGGSARAFYSSIRTTYETTPQTSSDGTDMEPVCNDAWTCSPWGDCIDGIKTRQCGFNDDPTCVGNVETPIMEEKCGTPTVSYEPPEEIYEPEVVAPQTTCNDAIQNQGEEGIDCGGPCMPCKKPFNIWIWLIPVLGIVIGLVTWLAIQEPKIKDAPSYVKAAKKRGYTRQEIVDNLRKVGYTDTEIKSAFRK